MLRSYIVWGLGGSLIISILRLSFFSLSMQFPNGACSRYYGTPRSSCSFKVEEFGKCSPYMLFFSRYNNAEIDISRNVISHHSIFMTRE